MCFERWLPLPIEHRDADGCLRSADLDRLGLQLHGDAVLHRPTLHLLQCVGLALGREVILKERPRPFDVLAALDALSQLVQEGFGFGSLHARRGASFMPSELYYVPLAAAIAAS